MQSGQRRQALEIFARIPPGTPAYVHSCAPHALCLRDAGRPADALELAHQAVDANGDDAWNWMLLGSIQTILALHPEAEASLRRSIALAPMQLEAHHYLGLLLQDDGRFEQAIAHYQVVAAHHPTEVFNIAQCQEYLGRWEQARHGYQAMHALAPQRADVLARLAHMEALLCEFDASSESCRRLANRLEAGPLPVDDRPQPFTCCHLPLSAAQQRLVLDHAAAGISAAVQPLPPLPARASERLRVGYLSADLGEHTVGQLVSGMFEAHDRRVLEVFVYSNRTRPDPCEQRLAATVEHYHLIGGLSDMALARQIREDAIDVLVDMSGYTQGGRLGALAYRPARIQLGWLGFLGPQQAPWLDGIILDDSLAPAGRPWPFADRVLRLPSSVFPASHDPDAQGRRAHFGLPEDAVLAASFNSSYKLSQPLLRCWVDILARAPAALLVVSLPAPSRPGFERAWHKAGGDRSRLLIVDRLPAADHLRRMACCDLFLDAFDYQAGATAIDAAGARLPLLCVDGPGPLARLGVSINRLIGMDGLICRDAGDYTARAVDLLNSPQQLARLRAQLRRQVPASRLFDPRRTARELEQLFTALASPAAASRQST